MITAAVAAVMPAAIATGLFTGLATFQSNDAENYPDGFQSDQFVDVPGLINIPCVDAPESEGSVSANESKAMTDITSTQLRHVLLDARYPTVETGWRNGWRVLLDGVAYDLTGAEPDSQRTQTRIRGRLSSI